MGGGILHFWAPVRLLEALALNLHQAPKALGTLFHKLRVCAKPFGFAPLDAQ